MNRHTHILLIALGAFMLLSPCEAANEFVERVLERAQAEVLAHVDYDATYYQLPYPAGDLPQDVGCCTDLVIRAYRNAGIDLQKEVREDYEARPNAYPVAGPDELTHRRCRHLLVWFRKHAEERPAGFKSKLLKDCKPGDVVFFNFQKYDPNFPEHVGIISDRPFNDGMPFVYDNLGPEAAERPLNSFPIIQSRFRWRSHKAGQPIEPRYAKAKRSLAASAPAQDENPALKTPQEPPVVVSLETEKPQEID